MSFKTKKITKNFLSGQISKEKEELKKSTENIDKSSLPFAFKIAIRNNFLPLSIDTYYE